MYNNPYRVSNKEVWGQWENNPNTSPEEKLYFRHFFDKFVNLALSRYEYDGLPDEIPPRMLNSYLLWQGMCLFKKEPITGLYGVFGVNLVGEPDIYGIPTDWIAYAMNGQYYEQTDKEESALIFARPFAVPEILSIILHAQSLAEKKASTRVNVIQQRTPVVISGDSTQKLSIDNFIQKWVKNIPFIKAKNDLRKQIQIDTIDLKVHPIFNELDTAAQREVAECLADLGIEASGVEKPERLVSAETSYNDGEIELTRNGNLATIQRGLDAINRMYGLNIHVHFNSKMVTPINRPDVFDTTNAETYTQENNGNDTPESEVE